MHGVPVVAQPKKQGVLAVQGHLVLDKHPRKPNLGRPFSCRRGVVLVQRVPECGTCQQVVAAAQGFVPSQLAKGDVLRGDVRHVSIDGVLPVPVGAELQHQPFCGGQLIRSKCLPPVGEDALAVAL